MSCIVAPHQTLLFSATMPRELDSLIQRFLKEPVRIELNTHNVAPSSLAHEFIFMREASRREKTLVKFLQDRSQYRQALIFCNSRFKGDHLYRRIRGCIPGSDYLHGGMEQNLRTRIFGKFKNASLPILLATDVAGRGLDFSNVSHVINYDFPRDPVTYTHRTGRAGRMGRKGSAVSYVTSHDVDTCFRIIEANRIKPIWHGEEPTPGSRRPRNRRYSRR
jgi:ATP-dependent RNA helicase DeaD